MLDDHWTCSVIFARLPSSVMARSLSNTRESAVEEFRTVLLDVWREACRHIEISRSTETIAALLGPTGADRPGAGGRDRSGAAIAWRRWRSASPSTDGRARRRPQRVLGRPNGTALGLVQAGQGEPRQPRPRRRVGPLGAAGRRGGRAGRSAGAARRPLCGAGLGGAAGPGLRAAPCRTGPGPPGAVLRRPGQPPSPQRDGRPARGGRGREAIAA